MYQAPAARVGSAGVRKVLCLNTAPRYRTVLRLESRETVMHVMNKMTIAEL